MMQNAEGGGSMLYSQPSASSSDISSVLECRNGVLNGERTNTSTQDAGNSKRGFRRDDQQGQM